MGRYGLGNFNQNESGKHWVKLEAYYIMENLGQSQWLPKGHYFVAVYWPWTWFHCLDFEDK